MQILLFTMAPVAAAIVGAGATAWRKPGPQLVSAIQHFAAGVVFAAAAGEILPDLKHAGAVWPVMIGGTAGILAMLLVQAVEARAKGAAGLLAIIGVDIFIDGLVLGLSFLAGQTQGLLLTIALTIEILFLGLTIAVGLQTGNWLRSVGVTALMVLLLPLGALLSTPISHLPPAVITGCLAFGLVALLYLVTEELLVEAHEVLDRPWITAMFFVGFLLLLLLADLMEGAPTSLGI
jgi:ZIP family zinc transporter